MLLLDYIKLTYIKPLSDVAFLAVASYPHPKCNLVCIMFGPRRASCKCILYIRYSCKVVTNDLLLFSLSGPISIASNQPLLHLKSLHVAVPTLELKVDASCCYDDIVYVEGFEPTFKLAGGVNLPKIITCRGSDGIKRRQLVKVRALRKR